MENCTELRTELSQALRVVLMLSCIVCVRSSEPNTCKQIKKTWEYSTNIFTSGSDQMSPHVAPAFLALTWQKESGTIRNHLCCYPETLVPFGSTWYQLLPHLCKVANCHESSFPCQITTKLRASARSYSVQDLLRHEPIQVLGIFFQPRTVESPLVFFPNGFTRCKTVNWIRTSRSLHVLTHTLVGHLRISGPVNMLWSCAVSHHTQHAASGIVALIHEIQ